MALEAENIRLREALIFAERGWRDALGIASQAKGQQTATSSRAEDLLEIKSLQHEVNVLQRQILKRAQMADELRRALSFTTDELEQSVDKLMVYLHAECPLLSSSAYVPPVWTIDFPSDTEVFSSAHLVRLGRTLRRLQAVAEWVREHNLEKFPHYESITKALAEETEALRLRNAGQTHGPGHSIPKPDDVTESSSVKRGGKKKKKVVNVSVRDPTGKK